MHFMKLICIHGNRDISLDVQVVQVDSVELHPEPVWLSGVDCALDLIVGDDASLFHVDKEQLAGHETALVDDLFRRESLDADFGSHDNEIVPGDHVTGRPESVPVQCAAYEASVAEDHGGRPVPGLHEG